MPRRPTTVLVSDAGLAAIDQLAQETSTDRSKAHRALLAAALNSPTVLATAREALRKPRV